MKRTNGLYRKIYDYENIHQAYLNARKGKRYRKDVLAFTNRLEDNLLEIQNELMYHTYNVGRYREFYVHEPKKRLVMALPFKDRVVQWAIYQVLNPVFDKGYIRHSYACRTGKGTHMAITQIKCWLKTMHSKPIYYLKMDVLKYFYRVDHAVLMDILRSKLKDAELLSLLELIINSNGDRFGFAEWDVKCEGSRVPSVGMPIGNLTSQMFANLYLNKLDQFIKRRLHVKRYLRFMDDSLVLSGDKSYLHNIRCEVERFLRDELHLKLNHKTTIRPIACGLEFVGYRIWVHKTWIKKSTALRIRRSMRGIRKKLKNCEITEKYYEQVKNSYAGLLSHCDGEVFAGRCLGDGLIRADCPVL